MQIKLLLKQNDGYHYVIKNVDKTFNEEKSLLDQLVDAKELCYILVAVSGKCYTNDVNDNNKLIEVPSDYKYALPNCFIYDNENNKNNGINFNTVEKYFLDKKIRYLNNLKFPLNDFDSIDEFFRQLFDICSINHDKFSELTYNNNVDFENMLNDYSTFNKNEITFLLNQINYVDEIMFGKQDELKTIKTFGYLRQQASVGRVAFLNKYVDDSPSDISSEDLDQVTKDYEENIQNLLNSI